MNQGKKYMVWKRHNQSTGFTVEFVQFFFQKNYNTIQYTII